MINHKNILVNPLSSAQNDFLRIRWKRFLIIFLRGKFAIMSGLLFLIFSCSSNCEELNDELVHLREKVQEYEDSLSSILRGNFVFQNINTASLPVEETDDSVTYKLMIVADSLFLYNLIAGVEVKYKGNSKGMLFKKNGFNYLNYPKPNKGEVDTLKLQYQYKDTSGDLFFELLDEIILE